MMISARYISGIIASYHDVALSPCGPAGCVVGRSVSDGGSASGRQAGPDRVDDGSYRRLVAVGPGPAPPGRYCPSIARRVQMESTSGAEVATA